MPTVFSLMGVKHPVPSDGRDASGWFQGKPPAGWKDQAYLRSTTGQRWLCVVSDRYKLVYSKDERPWLMDLEKDPDEAFNHIQDEQYASVVRALTRGLLDYCEAQNDPYGQIPEIRTSMLERLR